MAFTAGDVGEEEEERASYLVFGHVDDLFV